MVCWGGLLVLAIHFVLTLIYTVPGVPVPPSLHRMAYQYMVPNFHQGWKLFAPDVPDYHQEFRFRYALGRSHREWTMDTLYRHPRMHYALAKMSSAFNEALNSPEFGVYYIDSLPQWDRFQNSGAYKQFMYFGIKEFKNRRGVQPDTVQVSVIYHFTPGTAHPRAGTDYRMVLPATPVPSDALQSLGHP